MRLSILVSDKQQIINGVNTRLAMKPALYVLRTMKVIINQLY